MRLALVSSAAAIAALAMLAAPAFADDVVITLDGVQPRGGLLLVALQTEEQFLKPMGAHGARVASPVAAGPVTVTLKDVPPGTYSLSVLHDVNGDGQMAVDDKGMPGEGWAMKGGREMRGPPEWASASFTVSGGQVAIREAMIYP